MGRFCESQFMGMLKSQECNSGTSPWISWLGCCLETCKWKSLSSIMSALASELRTQVPARLCPGTPGRPELHQGAGGGVGREGCGLANKKANREKSCLFPCSLCPPLIGIHLCHLLWPLQAFFVHIGVGAGAAIFSLSLPPASSRNR